MQNFDILVIGNGVLGFSTAYALALKDPTLKIGVIGPANRLNSATTAAGAMLGCFGEVTKTTFQSEYGLAKLQMATKAAKMWPAWLEQLNSSLSPEDQVHINHGTFIILNTESVKYENDNFAAIIKALNDHQEPYEEVNPNTIPGLNPIDNCRPLRSLFIPNEGTINPIHLLKAYHLAARQLNNLIIMDDTVKSINSTATIKNISTECNGVIQADQIVLCAGAYCQTLIEQFPELTSRIPKILYGSGTALTLKYDAHQVKHLVRSPNRAGACGIHLMPRSNTTLYMGASNSVEYSAKNNPKLRDVYYLIQRAIDQFNQSFHKAEIIEWVTGNRPVTIDTFPLIGETSIPGLWLITGTYRDGFHDSPLIADSISNQILGRQPSFINLFVPERQPIQTMTKAQAIEEFVNQYAGAGYEHAMQLPKVGWDQLLREMMHDRISSLYNELEIDIGIPTDILIMLEHNRELLPILKAYYQNTRILDKAQHKKLAYPEFNSLEVA